jgi:hypothetical protein
MPDEVTVLLSEVEIGPYTIKPWSFGRFKKVFPILAGLVPLLRDMGLTAENVKEALLERGLEVVGAALPAISPLIAVTLDIPEEGVEEMDFGQAAVIGLTIISQNIEQIKNSLPLLMAQIQAMTRAA